MRHMGFVVALTVVGGVGDQNDKSFVDKALAGGMAEVKLAELAMEKGQSMEVRQFARKMMVDHNKANTELRQIADKMKLEAPTQLDDAHQKTYDRLARLSGHTFDVEYMKFMVQDHQDTVRLFKEQMQNGQDPDLKSFAMKTLPTLEKHDDMAKVDERNVQQMTK